MTTSMRLLVFSLGLAACGSAPSSAPPPSTPAAPAAPAPAKVEAPSAEIYAAGELQAPEDAPEAKAVFITLRSPGVPGPPLVAKRLPPGPFPLSFTLTEADRPMVRGPLPEELELKATLDMDGNPMAKSPDDRNVVQPVKKGATGLSLTFE